MSERKQQLLELSKQISEKDREEFAQVYSKMVFKDFTHVYIDLQYLQDIYLGGLLLMTKDQEVYQYILNNLQRYNNRYLREHVASFPELNITEDQLLRFISDPRNTDLLLKLSPPTTLYRELEEIHLTILDLSPFKEKSGDLDKKVEFVINTYPLKLTMDQIKFLKRRFTLALGTKYITFGVLSQPSHMLSYSLYSKFNIWFLYHFNDWSEIYPDSPGTNAVFKKGLFVYNRVYIPPRIINPNSLAQLPSMTESDLVTASNLTLITLSLYGAIEYYRPDIILV